jgi:hypothetical protein
MGEVAVRVVCLCCSHHYNSDNCRCHFHYYCSDNYLCHYDSDGSSTSSCDVCRAWVLAVQEMRHHDESQPLQEMYS